MDPNQPIQNPNQDIQAPPTAQVPTPPPVATGPRRKPNKPLMTLVLLVLTALLAAGIYYATKPSSTKITSSSSQPAATSSTTVVRLNAQPTAAVSITKAGFVPTTIQIKKGQGVIWTNQDTSAHYVISDDTNQNEPAAKLNSMTAITPTQNFTYVFATPGTYTYHDTVNPAFTGIVIVK